MTMTYIMVEAARPIWEKKVLGVSLLGRLINEQAMLGRDKVMVICEVDIKAVEQVLKGEILPRISVHYRRCAEGDTALGTALAEGAKQEDNVLAIPADLVLSRDFTSKALETSPVGDKALLLCGGEKGESSRERVVKMSARTAGTIAAGKGRAVTIAGLDQKQTLFLGGHCFEMEDQRQLGEAKNHLLQSLRKPMETDGVLGYWIMRPVTLQITKLIANTPVHPNHVTILTMLIGLVGAVLVAAGGHTEAIVGAGLYFAACYFDCLDGELARVKYKMSYLGAWMDTLSDDIQTFFFTGAMGIYLVRFGESNVYLVLALITMVIFAASQAYLYYQLHVVIHSGDLLDFHFIWEKGEQAPSSTDTFTLLKYLVKRDFFTALFFLLFLFRVPHVAVILVSSCCTLYAAAILVHVLKTARLGRLQTRS